MPPKDVASHAEPGDVVARWRADDAVSGAVASRSRQAHLAHQAAEEIDLASVLLDLAETGSVVSVLTTSGRRHVGMIASVGRDFVEVRSSEQKTRTFIPLAALGAVQPHMAAAPPAPLRSSAPRASLAEILSSLVENRPRLVIWLAGAPGQAVNGVLCSVGSDVLVVASEDGSRRQSYLRLESVAEVSAFGSG